MSMLLLALLVVAMLPYLAKAPVAKAMHQLGGYDNHHPRAQQGKLTGLGQRATAAHCQAHGVDRAARAVGSTAQGCAAARRRTMPGETQPRRSCAHGAALELMSRNTSTTWERLRAHLHTTQLIGGIHRSL